MHRYVINAHAQAGGEHEVHHLAACPTPPEKENQLPLGDHPTCQDAVAQAKRRHPNWIVDGCQHCIPACHFR